MIKLIDMPFEKPFEKKFKKKLIKQIGRLCEKQYRKGFQQGYFAKEDNNLTPKEVNDFRYKGVVQNYSKVICPVSGQKWTSVERLDCEMMMDDMEELRRFLTVK
jgi:hypothetical protein